MGWDFLRDVAAAFAGPGTVRVQWGSRVARGFPVQDDTPVADEAGAQVLRRDTLIGVPRGLWPDLVFNEELQVDGARVYFRDRRVLDDGALEVLVVATDPDPDELGG